MNANGHPGRIAPFDTAKLAAARGVRIHDKLLKTPVSRDPI
jgi:hypothetical protein